jgi:uncharacterized protein
MTRIIVDTNIFLAAVLQPAKTCRSILRLVLGGKFQALMSEALFYEYEDILARDALFLKCPISARERKDLLNAFLNCCQWINIYYRWRPNLRDEADNHLIELAVAGQAELIITRNIRDLISGELHFDNFRIITPELFLKEFAKWEQ